MPALAQVSSDPGRAPVPTSPTGRVAEHASTQAAGSIWATDVPGWITAVGTGILAIFAIVTAIYAIRAYRKQSQEVRDQAEMLSVQSRRLDLQNRQLEGQREVNELQVRDLRESLDERTRLRRLAEREQANDVGFAWWPSSHVLIMNPPVQPLADTTSRPVALTGANTSGMSVLAVDNASRRRIPNATCRIAPSEDSGLTLTAERTGQLTDVGSSAHRAMMSNPAEGDTVPLIRVGSQYGFLFRFDIEQNPDARLAVRFTDDAGLHWQIDQDLHLEPLGNRDW